MPADITMTLDERRKYLLRMRLRYVQANRPERSRLLDEMEQVTELHRKSLLRLMKAEPVRQPRQQQRGRTYKHEVDDVIRVVAESLDYICAERLTPGLVPTTQLLVKHGELTVSEAVLAQLGQISISTVKRILTRLRQDERRLPRRKPQQAHAPAARHSGAAHPLGSSRNPGTSRWTWCIMAGRARRASTCTRCK